MTNLLNRSDIYEEILSGRVIYYEDDKGTSFMMPATEQNQEWFREVMGNAISGRTVTHT